MHSKESEGVIRSQQVHFAHTINNNENNSSNPNAGKPEVHGVPANAICWAAMGTGHVDAYEERGESTGKANKKTDASFVRAVCGAAVQYANVEQEARTRGHFKFQLWRSRVAVVVE